MGVILDTSVVSAMDKEGGTLDFSRYAPYGDPFISAITVSELLVGVQRSAAGASRVRRAAYVEAVLAKLPSIPFTRDAARVHANLYANLATAGKMIGANDLIIAATAVQRGFAVLTTRPVLVRTHRRFNFTKS